MDFLTYLYQQRNLATTQSYRPIVLPILSTIGLSGFHTIVLTLLYTTSYAAYLLCQSIKWLLLLRVELFYVESSDVMTYVVSVYTICYISIAKLHVFGFNSFDLSFKLIQRDACFSAYIGLLLCCPYCSSDVCHHWSLHLWFNCIAAVDHLVLIFPVSIIFLDWISQFT